MGRWIVGCLEPHGGSESRRCGEPGRGGESGRRSRSAHPGTAPIVAYDGGAAADGFTA